MDPIQQILAQGQAGDQNGGLQQYYFEGQRLGQQQQQINLQQQRLQLEQRQQANADVQAQDQHLFAPLRQKAEELNNQKTGIDIMKSQAEAEASINTLHGDLRMTQMIAQRTANGTIGTPDAMAEANDIIQKTPYAGLGKAYQQFAQQFQIAQASNKLAAQFGAPTAATVTDKETGTAIQYGAKAAPTADIQDVKQIADWRAQAAATSDPSKSKALLNMADNLEAKFKDKQKLPGALSPAGKATMDALSAQGITKDSPDFANAYQQEFNNQQARVDAEHRLMIKTNPDGSMEFQQGAAPKGDNANVQKLKEQTLGLTDTAKQIQTSLLPNLENIYGPKATLGNFVVDKSFANINPDLAVGQRIAGREAARYLYQGVLRQLNHNQRVNAQQEKELKNAFPALEGLAGMHESPADAKVILQQLQKQLARDSYVKQRLIGDQPDTETLQFLDPKFLVDEVKAGRLSEENATNAMSQSPFQDEIKALVTQSKNAK